MSLRVRPSTLASHHHADHVFCLDLRIGGNTGDYMVYDPTYQDWGFKANPNSVGAGTIASDSTIYGPRFYEALNRFPPGTPITYGLNLAYQEPDYISRIVQQANLSRAILTQVQLVSFEIGNEVDLYVQNAFRTAGWSGQSWLSEWRARAAAIYTQVLKPNNISSNFFEPAVTANTIGNTFGISTLTSYGALEPGSDTNGTSYVASWNQHDYYYYIGISTYTLTMSLFQNLANTYSQFAQWVVQSQQAYATGIPFVLREMGSVGPVGERGISDTFGAALWTLNFFLYTATLNMSSVQLHMTDNSWAAAWQPIRRYGMPPHVRPSYYAYAAMAQIIGGSCSTRVQTLPVTGVQGDYVDHIGAYSVYRNDSIAALVLINTRIANADVDNKPALNFALSLPSHAGATIFTSTLAGAGTDATANTTWNGLEYESQTNGVSSNAPNAAPTSQTLDANGRATIPVRDASAVVVALDNAIGSGPFAAYNDATCVALGNMRPEPRMFQAPSPTPAYTPLPSTTSSPSHTGTCTCPAAQNTDAPLASGPDTSQCGSCTSAAGERKHKSGAFILSMAALGVSLVALLL